MLTIWFLLDGFQLTLFTLILASHLHNSFKFSTQCHLFQISFDAEASLVLITVWNYLLASFFKPKSL